MAPRLRQLVLGAACLAACGGEGAPGEPDADPTADSAGDEGTPDGTPDVPDATPLRPPTLAPIADRSVDEDVLLEVPLVATDAERIEVTGLPPGARFDRAAARVVFRPDFVQGGGAPWTVTVRVANALGAATTSFRITVVDSIRPPALAIAKNEDLGSCRRLTVTQRTDAYTDSPGHSGRTFTAVVVVPKAAAADAPVPVRVALHGVGGAPSTTTGCTSFVSVQPHDPMTSYWWGYSDKLPGGAPTTGTVPPYTARRVLQLVEWVQRSQGGDPRRTFVTGTSMGGAGALALGLLWARHFAGVESWWGQAVARNHRPARLATLEKLWGTREANLDDGAGMGVWDRLDLTRALRDEPEAAGQFVFVKHGKDDDTIHFGAVVLPSPLTKLTFYAALRGHPHHAVWDEGAHGPADPVLGDRWWDGGWSRMTDATAFLRRDLVVPAFADASHDEDPGDGTGNGKVKWDANAGYAGAVAVPGDTGWTGALAGAKNRHLRWDASKVVDDSEQVSIPLRAYAGTGKDPPRAGYPTVDDKIGAPLPLVVDVTLRRIQRFQPTPGATVQWTFGAQKGTAVVAPDGAIAVPRLRLGTDWTVLRIAR